MITASDLVDWIQFDYVDTEFTSRQISTFRFRSALPLLSRCDLAGLGFAARRRKAA
ncbi:MAG: hypothetical protein R3C40_07125 [Parvularculaceae bacterium]